MAKPNTFDGYNNQNTLDCERVLVTLLRGLGPWKESVCLIGGLTPRYLVSKRPPDVRPHAGTLDVDVVIDLQILADTEAYYTLEENITRMGFERAKNDKGESLSWRWQTRTDHGALIILEFLADHPSVAGGRLGKLPTDGKITAITIPHSSIVFDLYQYANIQAELLGGNGIVTERVKHANIVSFTCLKLFAFDDRTEPKDAHDLIYCIEYAQEGLDAVASHFRKELGSKHSATVATALDLLRKHFATEANVEGYLKTGPTAVAKFEFGNAPDQREGRILRQRDVSDLIDQLLTLIG